MKRLFFSAGFCILVMITALVADEPNSQAKGAVTFNPPVSGLGSKIKIEVVKFDPPILFFGDKLLEGKAPFWAESVLWALNRTSEEIPLYFDPSYIKEYGNPQLNRKPPAIFTGVYFGITISIGEEHFILVGSSYGEDRSQLIGRGAAVAILKKYGDKWKRTAAPDWVSYIPWTNLPEVFNIIDRGAATLDSSNRLKAL